MKQFTIAAALIACIGPIASAQGVGYVTINGVRVPKCERILTAENAARYSMLEPLRDIIENIEVVKGPTAVRLYGPDAVQGAILIDLKKGASAPSTLCNASSPEAPVFIVDGQRVESSPSPAPSREADPITRYLYAPELVIAHQEAIGLTGPQRMAIQVLAATSGSQVTQANWKLSTGTEKLAKMLAGPVVSEAAVLQQIDEVLALEREVKRAQLSMLVHVKNQLTAAQQEKLDKLK